jgi:serine protease Do
MVNETTVTEAKVTGTLFTRCKSSAVWAASALSVVSLSLSAAALAQRDVPALKVPEGTGPVVAADVAARGMTHARELSAAFQFAAQNVIPGVVAIEAIGKVQTVVDRHNPESDSGDDEKNDEGGTFDRSPLGQGSPFEELFKNDPRFRELFKGTPRRNGPAPRQRGMGSGFVIDPAGVIMTNAHVIENAETVRVRLHDGREYVATEFKADPKSDVAIVRIKPDSPLTALRLGNSDSVGVGEWVLAVGSPFGLDLSVTAGIVSAKGRGPNITEREDFIQTDAAVNPGNSGGPLVNLDGEVVGINTAISTRSGGYDGVAFAVPVNMARWVGEQLTAKGAVSRAYLGVAIQPVEGDLARQFGVDINTGAVVTQVMKDTPAADAKLEPGDVIVRLDGKPVRSPRALQGIVEQLAIGKGYPLVVRRGDKDVELTITMKEMPQDYTLSGRRDLKRETAEPAKPTTKKIESVGVELTDLTDDVAKQLGYNSAGGVLVASVTNDSPAAEAGVQAGMVIERIGSTNVTKVEEVDKALEGVSIEKGILLLVRTPRGTQFVVVKALAK